LVTPSIDFSHWHAQENAIAQGALTNSKHPKMHVFGVYPTHCDALKNYDCYLFSHDGKKYIDFICGLGTNLLGYGNDLIARHVAPYLRHAQSPSLPTELEVKAVEELRTLLPMAERVKWLKSGSEACSAAVKIARAHTGRSLIYSDAYHGWHSEFTTLTPPANGCPYSPHIKKLTEEADLNDAAAVIIEPVITDWSDERRQYLYDLASKAKHSGCLLIFDEVITGFRFTQNFVCRWLNIEPDMVIVGKAIANGFPLAGVVGKKDIMDGDYFVSSTYAGETMSLAAAIKSMNLMRTNSDYDLAKLWAAGANFLERFNNIWPEGLKIEGYPTRGVFKGSPTAKALFFQEMADAGVLFCSTWFFNHHLAKHTQEIINLSNQIMKRIRLGEAKLRGELPQSPFAMRARQ
jgi:glutamate-1-semialdehyde 2,1-aminomutase